MKDMFKNIDVQTVMVLGGVIALSGVLISSYGVKSAISSSYSVESAVITGIGLVLGFGGVALMVIPDPKAKDNG